MTSIKKFIFIESNTSGTGELLIRKAYEKKLHPIFITKTPEKYSFIPAKNVEVLILDTLNRDELLEYLLSINDIHGIYSSSEYYIETAAWLAEKLNLPCTHSSTIKLCRNKYLLYEVLFKNHLRCAKTLYLSNIVEAEGILRKSFYPLVIKPNSGSGSIGVKFCQNREDANDHIQRLFKSAHTEILFQEYIEGQEYSVEVFSIDGHHHFMGITKKYLCSLPNFIETGHDFPAIMSSSDEEIIKLTVEKLLSLINFNFGFSHIELKITEGKVVVIEVNPRLAGGMIPVLIQKSTGFDVLDFLLEVYTGQLPDIQFKHKYFSSIRHLVGEIPGVVKGFNYRDSSFGEVVLVKEKGDVFIPQGDFRDRLAYVITTDENPCFCQEHADKLIQNISVNIE